MAQTSQTMVELASAEDRELGFTAVLTRKEKRKAARATETDSEAQTEGDSTTKTVKKKKKKMAAETPNEECAHMECENSTGATKDDEESVEVSSFGDLKSRSISILNRISAMISKSGLKPSRAHKILSAATELKEVVNDALLHHRFLDGQIKNLKEDSTKRTAQLAKTVEQKLQEAVPPKRPLTFAERVGVKAKNISPASVKEPRNILTIFPGKNEELKTSDAVKEAVRKLVSPQSEGIGIRNVRKIHNNGILIETDKRGDLETLLKNQKLKEAGMEVGLPSKRQPRIIVFGVPRPASDEAAINDLLSHNFKGEELAKMKTGCRVAFKTGDKTKDRCNIVLEVTKEAREALNKRERLYVGWECCRFQDYLVPTRCFKCQSYGHITKHCKAEKETCGHCGELGHSHKECKSKEKPAVCINCKRAGKPSNHSIKDKECFAYKAATQVVISRTDYGL